MDRSILHLDLDAFYASVEQLDFPDLRGQPVIVGGRSERGVVCAASYEARSFGVHSAMPMMRALQLCPQARTRAVRMERYRELSQEVFSIYRNYTDLLEPLSLDEAFLDVTGSRRLFGAPSQIGQKIRERVREETGLTVSAGVGPNKFLAKMASGRAKPDGLFEIDARKIGDFLDPLPVVALWGIGQASAERLEAHGLCRVADLKGVGEGRLRRILGEALGSRVHRLAQGIDERPVGAAVAERSLGAERTYEKDLVQANQVEKALLSLAEEIGTRVRSEGLQAGHVTLKVRFADFTTLTRRQSCSEGFRSTRGIFEAACALVSKAQALSRPVRLLGIALGGLQEADLGQGELFCDESLKREERLDGAIDELRQRFGRNGITRGRLLTDD